MARACFIVPIFLLSFAVHSALAQEEQPAPDSIEALRAAAANGDASVRVKTTTFNDGAEPNNATVTTQTNVTRPAHRVAQGAPMEVAPDVAEYSPVTDPDSKLVYLSGGIGAAEIAYFKQLKEDYTLKLLTANKEGHLVSEVTVVIQDAVGKNIATLPLVGPYLLVKLPPGRYTLVASLEGREVTRAVTVTPGKQTAVDVRF